METRQNQFIGNSILDDEETSLWKTKLGNPVSRTYNIRILSRHTCKAIVCRLQTFLKQTNQKTPIFFHYKISIKAFLQNIFDYKKDHLTYTDNITILCFVKINNPPFYYYNTTKIIIFETYFL